MEERKDEETPADSSSRIWLVLGGVGLILVVLAIMLVVGVFET